MKLKAGVMGSADEVNSAAIVDTGRSLGRVIADQGLVLLTGATTGLIHEVGLANKESGGLHIGISPAANQAEHVERYGLPTDACDVIVYTGFGLKGRNVVLVRSCDLVIFIAGSIGSLNEFTISYDEGKVIGCLTGTGGVADEAAKLTTTFPKKTAARLVFDSDPLRLVQSCLSKLI